MIEKICSNCGTTLLVGLRYCPGCLRPIDRSEEVVEYSDVAHADDEGAGADSFFLDVERIWDNYMFRVKSGLCWIFGRPEPKAPPAFPQPYRPVRIDRETKRRPTLALTPGYTRVVCPKCLRAQRLSLELTPSDVVTCPHCIHPFPGSFAAEFRKGADLECVRCGVTTFCITGHKVTECPNCRYSGQSVTAKTRIKPKVLATVAASIFLGFFAHAIFTQTTTHFIVGTCLAIVGSFLGFVTMVALGF